MKKMLVLIIAMILSVSITACTENDTDYSLSEIEPYINHLGDVLDGTTLTLSEEEQKNIDNVTIANINGGVSYFVTSFGKVFNIVGSMKWESNENGYNEKNLADIKQAFVNFYNIENDTGESEIIGNEFKCKNDYYTIECNLDDEGIISISWDYNSDNYDKNEIAGLAAIDILKTQLKNPDSLQVHEVAYAVGDFYSENYNDIGIRVDYSAQNSFGGYERDYYYVFINPDYNQYSKVNTFLTAETTLDSVKFSPLNISDIGNMKKEYNADTITELIQVQDMSSKYPNVDKIMDNQLIQYLNYFDLKYSDTEFDTSQAKDAQGTKYDLDNARFVDKECYINVVYDKNVDDVAKEISMGFVHSDFTMQELKDKLIEILQTKPYYESDSAFCIEIPDTDLFIDCYDFSEGFLPCDIYITKTKHEQ